MPAPYYQDDTVTLYLGNALEITAWTAADVLVTDPPYGIGYRSSHAKHRVVSAPIAGDRDTATRDAALELWGPIRPALVFGRWDVPRPNSTHMRLVWDKNLLGTGDLRSPWGQSDEEIYVLGQ